MATTKPRITITLEPRTYEVVSRMAKAGGESMSAVVTGIVDLAVPSFERAVAIVERAQSAGDEVRAGIKSALDRADRDLMPMLLEAVKQSDMFLAGVGHEAADGGAAPAPRRRRPVAGAAAPKVEEGVSTPVPVTRGSGGRQPGAKRAVKGAKRGPV